MTRAAALLAVALLGCAPKAAPLAPPGPPPAAPAVVQHPAAVAGVTDPALRSIVDDHWGLLLTTSPEFATTLGEHRFDGQLDDHGPAARAAWTAARDLLLARLDALDPVELEPADRITRQMLRFDLRADRDEDVCRFEDWSLSPRSNPVGWVNGLHQDFPQLSPEAGADLLRRYQSAGARIDQDLANLRRGLADGRVANAESVRRTLALVDAELARPAGELEGLAPTRLDPPDGWEPAAFAAWQAELAAAFEAEIRPAWVRTRDLLRDQLLPAARTGDAVGMGALPDGPACYAARVRRYTTLDRSPEQVHQAGLDAIAAVHAEFADLGEGLFGTRDVSAIFARLRTDPTLRFEAEDQVEAAAVAALTDAKAAMGQSFGRLPQADCGVERMPAFEAPYSTIAYYRPALSDGSRPGAYVVNTYAPETRPRHEARALAVHEAIPGHHLQIAIAQELPETPAFRKHLGATAFVEGWALYAERLADEQGLYRDDLDRMGMLAYDAWRSSRLVVDTGIHHLGWTREQAIAYMTENTPLAPNNIDNEVDRYISWPGQAVAYKTGQVEILALRAEAEAALGGRFDAKGFHDVVLGGGAVTLPVLRARVEAWIAAAEAP